MGRMIKTMRSNGLDKSIALFSPGLGVLVGICKNNGGRILNIFFYNK